MAAFVAVFGFAFTVVAFVATGFFAGDFFAVGFFVAGFFAAAFLATGFFFAVAMIILLAVLDSLSPERLIYF